jgi:imidazolonepropionase-like amidohydrolase
VTVSNATVVIEGATIAFAGARHDAPVVQGEERVFRVPTIMPGLWDAHCHFFGIPKIDLGLVAAESPIQRAMRVGRDATRALMAGITSVREVGGLGVYLQRAIAEGTVRGPNVYAAGSILSMTGGHGDIHDIPLSLMQSGERVVDLELCDGVPECIRGVRRQLRRGARVIKVCATGGVLSRDDMRHPQFSEAELRAIVEEAARAERLVAAHCHGKAGIMAAVRAGVGTIEHGTFLDAEAAAAMAESGAILVSTRFVGHDVLQNADAAGLPEFARAKLAAAYDAGRAAVAHAIAAGVKIAAGTDMIHSGDHWGRNGLELKLLVDCGLSPLEAIEAATATAALTVGKQAEGPGFLEDGAPADLIAVRGDPLADIGILDGPGNVSHVWLGGSLVKDEGQAGATTP